MALLNKTGIGAGNIIQPSHVTNLYDTFNGTGSFDVIATGSFTGSFRGDGSHLTGIVSSKWTGSNPISRESDVEITGSLNVSGAITATGDISGSSFNGVSIESTGGKTGLTTIGVVDTAVLYISSSDRIFLYTDAIRLEAPTVKVEPIVKTFSLGSLNSGSTAGAGFVLPSIRPTTPATGSMHVSGSGVDLSFYVYDGSVWRQFRQ